MELLCTPLYWTLSSIIIHYNMLQIITMKFLIFIQYPLSAQIFSLKNQCEISNNIFKIGFKTPNIVSPVKQEYPSVWGSVHTVVKKLMPKGGVIMGIHKRHWSLFISKSMCNIKILFYHINVILMIINIEFFVKRGWGWNAWDSW